MSSQTRGKQPAKDGRAMTGIRERKIKQTLRKGTGGTCARIKEPEQALYKKKRNGFYPGTEHKRRTYGQWPVRKKQTSHCLSVLSFPQGMFRTVMDSVAGRYAAIMAKGLQAGSLRQSQPKMYVLSIQ
ncbi:MAG: hypothetical protein NC344_01825 [Bacteroidales bacterium]|nr:hypothetical protein [Bacteroidales bacterium]MCM1146572.1 hypothetical protein [Bacteroidales bacterium]MCM1205964.1 hypothetical protein [Bacillota bacterium]MCM1510156.1 hypothetical protein [Clostridium sp.]